MSRHGYVDDFDDTLALGRYRGRVMSAIRGKRGQAFLREIRDAMDAMPEKRLVARELIDDEGNTCAMGCVAKSRGIDVSKVDPDESEQVAATFGVAEVLVREIAYENDDEWGNQTPEARWAYMRKWLDRNIKAATP